MPPFSKNGKNMKNLIIAFLLLAFSISVSAQGSRLTSIEGHRGAKGYFPENTIPAFILAIEQGADTIEMDVVISKDKLVVVSHEPWFASAISTSPDGTPITKENEREHNMYQMTYDQIKKYDVGIRGHADFPTQVPLKVHKPLMTEVFQVIEKYSKDRGLPPVRYNIEIKSNLQSDGTFHPEIPEFVDLILKDVAAFGLQRRVIIQSFDVRPLQLINKNSPEIFISFLVSNRDGIEKNLERLGFTPDSYSPHFSLVDAELIRFCRENKMQIVPWTVNSIEDLIRMRDLGIDAIITDYPDRAVKVFRNK